MNIRRTHASSARNSRNRFIRRVATHAFLDAVMRIRDQFDMPEGAIARTVVPVGKEGVIIGQRITDWAERERAAGRLEAWYDALNTLMDDFKLLPEDYESVKSFVMHGVFDTFRPSCRPIFPTKPGLIRIDISSAITQREWKGVRGRLKKVYVQKHGREHLECAFGQQIRIVDDGGLYVLVCHCGTQRDWEYERCVIQEQINSLYTTNTDSDPPIRADYMIEAWIFLRQLYLQKKHPDRCRQLGALLEPDADESEEHFQKRISAMHQSMKRFREWLNNP